MHHRQIQRLHYRGRLPKSNEYLRRSFLVQEQNFRIHSQFHLD